MLMAMNGLSVKAEHNHIFCPQKRRVIIVIGVIRVVTAFLVSIVVLLKIRAGIDPWG